MLKSPSFEEVRVAYQEMPYRADPARLRLARRSIRRRSTYAWVHPRVVLTPHNAADTDPGEISKYVARQIERFETGEKLENVVDRERGY